MTAPATPHGTGGTDMEILTIDNDSYGKVGGVKTLVERKCLKADEAKTRHAQP